MGVGFNVFNRASVPLVSRCRRGRRQRRPWHVADHRGRAPGSGQGAGSRPPGSHRAPLGGQHGVRGARRNFAAAACSFTARACCRFPQPRRSCWQLHIALLARAAAVPAGLRGVTRKGFGKANWDTSPSRLSCTSPAAPTQPQGTAPDAAAELLALASAPGACLLFPPGPSEGCPFAAAFAEDDATSASLARGGGLESMLGSALDAAIAEAGLGGKPAQDKALPQQQPAAAASNGAARPSSGMKAGAAGSAAAAAAGVAEQSSRPGSGSLRPQPSGLSARRREGSTFRPRLDSALGYGGDDGRKWQARPSSGMHAAAGAQSTTRSCVARLRGGLHVPPPSLSQDSASPAPDAPPCTDPQFATACIELAPLCRLVRCRAGLGARHAACQTLGALGAGAPGRGPD
jgi:hypothetical protein